MKIYKALKLKNKLVNDIAELKRKITHKNSRKKTDIVHYDIEKLYTELLEKTGKLIQLKSAINDKNVEIQGKIYRLAEYKGMISFLKTINTQEGVKKVGGFGEKVEEVFVVTYNEVEIEEKVNNIQKEIDDIQEEIDHFNYTESINFLD